MAGDEHERIGDLEAIFEHMSEGACVNDLVYDDSGTPIDYRVIDVNGAYERITGLTRAKATGALASELYGTGEPPFLDFYVRVAHSQVSDSFEFYWPPVKKHVKVAVISPRRGRFVVIFYDVTEIVEATAAAQKSEQQYRSLFHNYPVGLVLSELDSEEMIDCNGYIAELLGYPSREECLASYKPELHYTNPADREVMAARLTKDGFIENMEFEIRDTRGQPKWISYTARLDRESGVIEGAALDITEKRVVQQELYASQERLKMSQRVSKIGHYVVEDFTMGLWTSSEMLDELFGIDDTFERVFENWIKIVHEDDREAVQNHFAVDVIENRQPFDKKYRIVRQSDGEVRWMHGQGNLEISPDGQLLRMFGTIQDITERLDLEERLHQSEKMQAIGHLAGGVAHDFNNQLAGIVGYADLLREELTNNPPLAVYANNILIGTKRAADLTAQLLAFARKGKYLSIRIDIHKIIDEVISILQRAIDKRIIVKRSLDAQHPIAQGDPSQIQNAIVNLAINARDAMPNGGEMTFSTRVIELDEGFCRQSSFELSPGKYLEIRVRDTGTGMTEQTAKRIFEPFFTTKPPGKGTGMGLAAVYGTVKNHNGAIEVSSEPDSGTTMIVRLPQVDDEGVRTTSFPADSPIEQGNGHILLVDDESMVIEVATLMLVDLGYTVDFCDNGVEAIAYYEQHWTEVDLVILDMVMPQLSGKATYLKMKAINPDLIALISSGYSVDGEAQEILSEGAQGFIQKPYRRAALAAKIAEALDRAG